MNLIDNLPPALTARHAVTGLRILIVLILTLAGVIGCTVQTVRLDGAQAKLPLIGTIGPEGWKPYAQRLETDLAKVREAQAEAARQAIEAKKSEEEALIALAKETDDAVEEELRDELDRARRFIARNRVQPCAGSAAGAAAATAPDRGARNNGPAGGAAQLDEPATGFDVLLDAEAGFVSVPASDVMICTRNTILAEQWREWGLALEARGDARK